MGNVVLVCKTPLGVWKLWGILDRNLLFGGFKPKTKSKLKNKNVVIYFLHVAFAVSRTDPEENLPQQIGATQPY